MLNHVPGDGQIFHIVQVIPVHNEVIVLPTEITQKLQDQLTHSRERGLLRLHEHRRPTAWFPRIRHRGPLGDIGRGAAQITVEDGENRGKVWAHELPI